MTQTFDPTLTLYEPAAEPLWTEEESAELELRLYRLLQSQFCSQTQGDSASVRMEEAAELMESIRYTLDLYLRLHGWPRRALLTQNLPVLFRAAQELLLTQVEETRQLYQRARLMVKPFGNQSLMDTLNGIGRFFSGYNARFRAQQIPADIDYQLCHPIPDAIQGVQYIREYLSRLLIENQLVTRMNPERVRALLSRACPD
ncbi:MAG TPA: DUF6179 domain-containing protein, partial [Candidatus Limiplasma sp.]|nr:DUF6179 domain-containing protein [Candidatus Limiplasma sp.]